MFGLVCRDGQVGGFAGLVVWFGLVWLVGLLWLDWVCLIGLVGLGWFNWVVLGGLLFKLVMFGFVSLVCIGLFVFIRLVGNWFVWWVVYTVYWSVIFVWFAWLICLAGLFHWLD